MEQPKNNQFIERIQAVNAIAAAYKIGDPKIHELLRSHGVITDNTPVTEVIDILRNDPVDPEIITSLKTIADESLAQLKVRQRADAIGRSSNPYYG